ncbi:MAG: HNH endonuclease [Methylococcaceae bacterium]|nr:HNH endonuclease [Methylococcaceae bacterium]
MRPVERGAIPCDKNGNVIIFKEYGDARNYLIGRLGDYCSYCEAPLFTPAIEHVQPKKEGLSPELEKDWCNFLLACTYCNSNKGDKPVNINNLNDYFWADRDNTLRAFRYEKDRIPQIKQSLNATQQQIAQNSLELTGLSRERGHPKFSKKDRRCEKRNEAWGKAERAKLNLNRQPVDCMREQIIDTATSTGFWSVWMTVFQDDTDMRQRLINAFQGTCTQCFDNNTQPIQRMGGNI